ncbi:MAG: hypothetical protein M3Z05_11240 [Gemmatimonadota bacterium]|nr:hypothetical protein [Gemmatimonadota bacterium]
MTDHPSFDQLCDLHDDALDVDAARVLRAHITDCASCTEQFSLLTTLGSATAALPATIAPPSDLWTEIKDELAPRRTTGRLEPVVRSYRQLAAAAVVIALGSSALTVAMMDRSHGGASAPDIAAAGSRAPLPTFAPLPASLASEESGFTRSVDVLQRTLDERRDSLAPSTVATVERSLRVVDEAIAEARDALARDPANQALARLFASNYEQKIDLLRRATELAPRT